MLERLGRNISHRVQFGLGESRERQLRESEARMGLPTGSLRQETDLNDIMDYGDDVQDVGAEVSSASVPSFADGLPQGEPSHQRYHYDDVDVLVAQMDQLTMGNMGAQSG